LLTGWLYADPLISIGIALLIARSAWGLLGEVPDLDETIGIALIALALAGVLRPRATSRGSAV